MLRSTVKFVHVVPTLGQAELDAIEKQLELFRALWTELHSKENANPEWFEDWLNRVPQIGCGCQKSFREYIADNPPRYDDWYAWTVEAHNWVNVKRGVAIWFVDKLSTK